MGSRNAALRVGMFVIGGVIALLAVIFFLSGSALHPGTPYETYFAESVQGLDVGTAVKFRGVTIGKITDIGLATAEYPPPEGADTDRKVYRQVVVRFRVNSGKLGEVNIRQAVAHGLRVQIEPQGITGLAYLELTFVSPSQYPVTPVPWMPESPVLPSIPSTLTQVQDAIEHVLSSFGKVDVSKMVGDLTQLVDTLDQEVTVGDAHKALANANTLLVNLNNQINAADLPATTAAARNLLQGKQLQQILSQLEMTTKQLAKASAQLPTLITASESTVNQASEATADLQSELQPVLNNLRNTTASLNALTQQLRNNPSQVLLGAQPPPERER